MNADTTYRPSGKFRPAAAVLLPLGGLAAGLVLGGVYGVLAWYVPLIIVNAALVVGTAFAVSFAVSALVKVLHVRNGLLAAAAGLAGGLAAFFAAWVTWTAAASEWEVLLLDPFTLFGGVVPSLLENGVWSVFGYTPTGVVLGALWLVEAALLVLGPAVLAFGHVHDTPYLEELGVWAGDERVIEPLAHLDAEERAELKRRLLAGEVEALAGLRVADGEAPGHTVARFRYAAADDRQQFLTLETLEPKPGQDDPTKHTIVSNLLIDRDGRAAIEEMLLAEAAAAPAPAPEPAEPDRP